MTKNLHKLTLGLLLMSIAGSPAIAATDIRLREQVAMRGSMVRLGDVAEVINADRQQARQLAAVPLIPAPAPGTQRFLRKREIEDLLAAQGVDLKELRIDGAAQVTIEIHEMKEWKREDASEHPPQPLNRHAAILAHQYDARGSSAMEQARAEEIRNELRRVVTGYLTLKGIDANARGVTCDVVERHVAVLETATSPLTCRGGTPPWTGKQRFVVSFTTANGPIEIPVYAEVALAPAPVVVALKPIGRGERITAEHVELRTMDAVSGASGRRAAVDSLDKAIGMEARQALQAGDMVLADQVQAPLLVKRGELITVSSQSSGIRVRTTARASKDGAHGEVVQVESLETRDRYDVRVVGPREAAVVAIAASPTSEPSGRVDTARR
jgi:flagella basal body P-ring formation protein FlgA